MARRQKGFQIAATLLAATAAGCASSERPAALSSSASPGSIILALDRRGTVGGFAVTPLLIEEDSRCPADVQCIQAGTVRLAVRIEGRASLQPILTLARPSRLDSNSWLTLCAVTPYPAQPGRIGPAAYRFRLVLHRGAAPPAPACPEPGAVGSAAAGPPTDERGLWFGSLHLCRDTIERATAAEDHGMPVLLITLMPQLKEDLRRETENRVGEAMPVRLDGRIVSEPNVMEPITGGKVSLSGASPRLIEAMRSGSLRPC
jgi:hypothetical protein